ncbi:MAG: hypothetical protein DWG83_01500 [Chloroflexi bacterium]|nr:hypothetical protein [Chloroflexota bacterium]MDA1239611.1 hypothetical protein [Chloroflexota bacterium]MQC19231.1 hypothetical protein [Chloroflexota bacterium]
MALIPLFRDEARRRGLLGEDDRVTAEVAFRLVRDMPYRRATDRQPETILREWTGTCSGKHYLLRALFEELGYATTVILVTHEFTAENSPWLPPHLLAQVAERPVPDVHTFLRVQHDRIADDWTTVDSTWPEAAARLGMPSNAAFVPGEDHEIACDPIEIFHVPEDEDPQPLKERVIVFHAGDQAERRDAFIEALSDWLAAELGG